jgi:hypothetical protein
MDNNAKWKTFTANDKIRVMIEIHVPAATCTEMES